jgi:archaemetzincin
MNKIIIVLLSQIDMHLIGKLKSSLERTFDCFVEIRYKLGTLKYAYDASRKQYISPRLLSRLKRMKRGSGDKILGVVNVDLYSPEYDFIYGEANVNSGVATLSTYRLISENPDTYVADYIFEERVIREATHEVGHLFGMDHCKNPRCLMRTCTCLSEVDEAGNVFCIECEKKLKNNLDLTTVASFQ